jgi:hypothetical protein
MNITGITGLTEALESHAQSFSGGGVVEMGKQGEKECDRRSSLKTML